MNDVVNPNIGLYHDQSLFNLIPTVKPLSAGLVWCYCFRYELFFFSQSKYIVEKKKSQDDKIVFFSQKKNQDD